MLAMNSNPFVVVAFFNLWRRVDLKNDFSWHQMFVDGRGAGREDQDNLDDIERMVVDVTDHPEPHPGPSRKARPAAAAQGTGDRFEFSSDSDMDVARESSSADADLEPSDESIPEPKKRRARQAKKDLSGPETETAIEAKAARKKSAGRKKAK